MVYGQGERTKQLTPYMRVFQPFSNRGTSQKFLTIWRNLNALYSTIYSIFKEPSKELAEPLGSAEPMLKNTALYRQKYKLSLYQLSQTHSVARYTDASLLSGPDVRIQRPSKCYLKMFPIILKWIF
jgi:hypothetical protein